MDIPSGERRGNNLSPFKEESKHDAIFSMRLPALFIRHTL